MDILKILPPQLCRKYSLIPVAKSKGRKLVVAFADPGDYEALDSVTAVAQDASRTCSGDLVRCRAGY